MAKLTYSILLAIIGMLLVYLAGAFTAASFDITEWDMFGRLTCATFMAMAGGFGVLLGTHIGAAKRKFGL